MLVHFNNARVEKMPLNIRIQWNAGTACVSEWNAGTACVSECVLKTLTCRGFRVGPSKGVANFQVLKLVEVIEVADRGGGSGGAWVSEQTRQDKRLLQQVDGHLKPIKALCAGGSPKPVPDRTRGKNQEKGV